MKKFLAVVLSLVICFTLFGCGSKKSTSNIAKGGAEYRESQTSSSGSTAPDQPAAAVSENSKADTTSSAAKDLAANVTDDRKIIQNASVTMDVKDLKGSYDAIILKSKAIGGYIASSNINENGCDIVVRIPASRMEDFLKYADTLGGQNKQVTRNSDDITEQYTDAASRLKNMKAEEEQLLDIMKKASTVEDTLKIQQELFRVRGEIESLQGKINMWDKIVELSTISVHMNKMAEMGSKDVAVNFLSWSDMARGMANGFKTTFNFMIRVFNGIFIVIVSIIPLLPIVAIALWIVLRYRKKKKKNISQ